MSDQHPTYRMVRKDALLDFIDYADGQRITVDGEFCVGDAERDDSRREFDGLVAALEPASDLRDLLDLLEPLMDPDFCQAWPSAWELDPHYARHVTELDGEQLHDRIKAIYERLRAGTTCRNCERCTWNKGPDCGRPEHAHCGTCGHCMGRHVATETGTTS